MTVKELYEAGQLSEAIEAAAEQVRKAPGSFDYRWLFCELLCFAGELERVDKQLEVLTQQDPSAAAAVALFRQLIRAAQAREQFYSEGRVPEFLREIPPPLELYLKASVLLREGDRDQAAQLLAEADTQRRQLKGECDGTAINDFRDLDDLLAPFFEVLTSTGKFYLIPIETVKSIEWMPPKRPRDLLWRQAHMDVSDGPEGDVYLPCLYAGSHQRDDQIRLGRATDWTADENPPVQGAGLRMFLVGEADKTILEINELRFDIE